MNWLLDHLWPFSEIRDMRRQRDTVNGHYMKQSEFGEACCALLDQVHQPWKHINFGGKLYIMGVDSVNVMERGAVAVIEERKTDGLDEIVYHPGWKGFDS